MIAPSIVPVHTANSGPLAFAKQALIKISIAFTRHSRNQQP